MMVNMLFVFEHAGETITMPVKVTHVTCELIGGPDDGSFLNVPVVYEELVEATGPRRIVTTHWHDTKGFSTYSMMARVEPTDVRFIDTAGEGEIIGCLWQGWVFKYRWRGWFKTVEEAVTACYND